MTLEQLVENFDSAAFRSTHAHELAESQDAQVAIDAFDARVTELGDAKNDRRAQMTAQFLEAKRAKWNRLRGAAAWKDANANEHAAWMAKNAELNAADGGSRPTS